MRIHSDTLTAIQIHSLVPVTAYVGKLSRHGSRKRDHAFEVNLGGSGKTGGQWGQQNGKAATWDEWGMFLAALYEADPEAVTPYYTDADDFHHVTGDRFRTLTPDEQHKQHRWEYQVNLGDHGSSYHACKGSKNAPCTAEIHRSY